MASPDISNLSRHRSSADFSEKSRLQKLVGVLYGFDFFISYAWADGRDYAVELAERLEKGVSGKKYRCFLDSNDYAKGDDWEKAGRDALKRTRILIVVGSPRALNSTPVLREVQAFTRRGDRVIPIEFANENGQGTFNREHYPSKLHDHIHPEILRIAEPLTYCKTLSENNVDSPQLLGPSEEVIKQIAGSFNLITQADIRARVFGFAAIVFAALTIVSCVLFYAADGARKSAASARDSATETAVRGLVRVIGTSPDDSLLPVEVEALWELAEVQSENEAIRDGVTEAWFQSPGGFANSTRHEGAGLKAALGISPTRHESVKVHAEDLARSLNSAIRQELQSENISDERLTSFCSQLAGMGELVPQKIVQEAVNQLKAEIDSRLEGARHSSFDDFGGVQKLEAQIRLLQTGTVGIILEQQLRPVFLLPSLPDAQIRPTPDSETEQSAAGSGQLTEASRVDSQDRPSTANQSRRPSELTPNDEAQVVAQLADIAEGSFFESKKFISLASRLSTANNPVDGIGTVAASLLKHMYSSVPYSIPPPGAPSPDEMNAEKAALRHALNLMCERTPDGELGSVVDALGEAILNIKEDGAYEQSWFVEVLLSLNDRLTAQQAAIGAMALIEVDYPGFALGRVSLGRQGFRTTEELGIATLLLARFSTTTPYDEECRRVLAGYCNSASPQDLAELLKWPLCTGEVETLVLHTLAEKTNTRFSGSLKSFIQQAAALGINNLDAPVVRPTVENARKELGVIIHGTSN